VPTRKCVGFIVGSAFGVSLRRIAASGQECVGLVHRGAMRNNASPRTSPRTSYQHDAPASECTAFSAHSQATSRSPPVACPRIQSDSESAGPVRPRYSRPHARKRTVNHRFGSMFSSFGNFLFSRSFSFHLADVVDVPAMLRVIS
jgi:hypothetical protein